MSENLACRQAREGLTEYLENALSSTGRRGVEKHFEACAECRVHLDRIRAFTRSGAATTRMRMPQEMKRRLLQAFRQQDPT